MPKKKKDNSMNESKCETCCGTKEVKVGEAGDYDAFTHCPDCTPLKYGYYLRRRQKNE